MLQKLRERSSSESGFTLVELLVVMLILGLLAAIAIPAFFNQRDKAKDADAKSGARSAQTAIETYSTDNDGSYVGADGAGVLTDIEETLTNYDLTVGGLGQKTYRVTVGSDTGTNFWIQRNDDGSLEFSCDSPGDGGCPSSGSWAGEEPTP
jgi:type IV pilus assembly protein PilA